MMKLQTFFLQLNKKNEMTFSPSDDAKCSLSGHKILIISYHDLELEVKSNK